MTTPAAAAPAWLCLVDFDGTATVRDADFEIADAVLPPGRERAYEPLARRYERLEIGMETYFRGYLALLGLEPDAIARHAREVALRPGLAELVATARALGMEPRIVSEGLDVYVLPALAAAGLTDVAVSCNRARRVDGGWEILPAEGAESCERCLNCKGAHVQRGQAAGRRVAIVGNGASDLCAARTADLVLARDTLAAHCEREGLRHERWGSFADVTVALRRAADDAGGSPARSG